VLDVVLLGEGVAVVRAYVLLKLGKGLGAEVLAIYQEQRAPAAGELDEPLGG